jgi:hypothetical protein
MCAARRQEVVGGGDRVVAEEVLVSAGGGSRRRFDLLALLLGVSVRRDVAREEDAHEVTPVRRIGDDLVLAPVRPHQLAAYVRDDVVPNLVEGLHLPALRSTSLAPAKCAV